MCLQLLILQLYVNLICFVLAEAFASQIFVATRRKPPRSLYLTDNLSNVNNSSNLGKRCHSTSSTAAAARVKSWKSEMLFYEPLSIKKRPVFEAVRTEDNPILFMFHLQQMKEKKKEKSEKVPVPPR